METQNDDTIALYATAEGIGMSSRKEHEKAGKKAALNAYLEYVRRHRLPPNEFRDLVAVFAANRIGRFFGTLPDRLEPATSPNHRGILHSQDVSRFLDDLRSSIQTRDDSNIVSDVIIDMAAAAYQTHIELDSRTPMGVIDLQPVFSRLPKRTDR